MLGNRDGTNEKPRLKVAASSQGKCVNANVQSNNTTFKDGKSRHDTGMELYKAGRISISSNGLFKVSGYYEADTERMTCTCPDYKNRKEPCKHIYAACLFVKNRGKQKIEPINGEGDWITKMMNDPDKPKEEPTNNSQEAPSKEFNRQSTITRLAVLNTATEILKTHRKPIEYNDIVSLAAQLEKWALSK